MIEIALIYRFKNNHNYQLTQCKNRVFNVKTGREVSITEKSRSIGAYISSKFIPLSKFDENIELIKPVTNNTECDRLLNQIRNINQR